MNLFAKVEKPWVVCDMCGGCGLIQDWYVEDCPKCGGSGDDRFGFENVL